MNPTHEQILKYFRCDHLPERLQEVSKRFYGLALGLADDESLDGREVSVALRKLLEAKDAAVRAAL